MNQIIKNARGHEVAVRPGIGPELMEWGRRLTHELMKHPEIIGVIAGGSCATRAADEFSDLDLYVFSASKPECEQRIHECCRKLGGRLDPDATSIHFPLDSPGYLFGDLYVEPGAITVEGVDGELDRILSAKGFDDGRIFSLRNGELLVDRSGEVAALQSRLRNATVPREYADWYTSIALDVPVKLIIHSVHRSDYPYAWHWLNRFYYECVRIIFARSGRFFPGMKRTLTAGLGQLPNVPAGFVEFWHETLSRGVSDWTDAVERVHGFAGVFKSLNQFEPLPSV